MAFSGIKRSFCVLSRFYSAWKVWNRLPTAPAAIIGTHINFTANNQNSRFIFILSHHRNYNGKSCWYACTVASDVKENAKFRSHILCEVAYKSTPPLRKWNDLHNIHHPHVLAYGQLTHWVDFTAPILRQDNWRGWMDRKCEQHESMFCINLEAGCPLCRAAGFWHSMLSSEVWLDCVCTRKKCRQ